MDAVMRCIESLPDERVLSDVASAVQFLAGRPEVRRETIGVTGFCLGGQYAIMAACRVAGLAACASFYGMLRYASRPPHKPASPLDLAAELRCPLLGLYGAEDGLIPPADLAELETILRNNGKTFRFHVYPGAGHAFMNEARTDAFRPSVAADAWNRAIEFFTANLAG
jgi:carboxymethylenebutenolidase